MSNPTGSDPWKPHGGLTVKSKHQPILTEDQFKRALPAQMRGNVNQKIIDNVNRLIESPELREVYRDNLLSYTSVMREGKFKLQSYVDAVRYVSFKLMGATNIEAYVKAFPDRYQRMVNEELSENHISGVISMYNKTKMVNLIFEQTMVPIHVLNADLYQEALNAQADLMLSARSEMVRTNAANSLLTHLKPPETQKIELDVGLKEDKSIDMLRQATLDLVAQQRKLIEAGAADAEEIAHSKIIPSIVEAEIIE